jgi:hypothetical protein
MLKKAADNGDKKSCLEAAILIGTENPSLALNYIREYLAEYPDKIRNPDIAKFVTMWEDGKRNNLVKVAYNEDGKEVAKTVESFGPKQNVKA